METPPSRTERPIAWDDEPPGRRAILLALDRVDLVALDTAARALRSEGLPHLIPIMVRVAMIRALVAGGMLRLDDEEE
jgi:hypothetical protein